MKLDRSSPQQLTMLLVIEPKPKPLTEAEIDALFETWYSGWPRKDARKAGRAAFGRIIKTKSATLDEITQGRDRYAEYVSRQCLERRSILHPASFLNGERWKDELVGADDAPRRPSRAQAAGFSRAAGFFMPHVGVRR